MFEITKSHQEEAVISSGRENRLVEMRHLCHRVEEIVSSGQRFCGNLDMFDQFNAKSTYINANGTTSQDYVVDKISFYPNGYININQDGNYTKHYYADAARIASKIGTGFADSISGGIVSNTLAYDVMINELGLVTNDTIDNIVYSFGQIRYLEGDSGKYENALYFYHGNHLSSTQLVTDIDANVAQAVLYTPWGTVISEYKADWMLDTIPRYLFQGKERDDESGMDYFEARYYSSDAATFQSRDPKFEKYFWLSPYCAFANNPVKIIDPTGKDGEIAIDEEQKIITVSANFYYSKENLSVNVPEKGTLESAMGNVLESLGNDIRKSFSELQEFDGYTIDIKFNMIGVEMDGATGVDALSKLINKSENDPIGNVLFYDPSRKRSEVSDNDIFYINNWATDPTTSKGFFSPIGTAKHEFGHIFGLWDRDGEDSYTGDVMTYSPKRGMDDAFKRILNDLGACNLGNQRILINNNNRETK